MMFIVLLDEPTLFVYQSPDAAVREIEPPDAERILRAAFDDEAVPYRVEWIRPNRWRKWFGGELGSVAFGEYRFEPAGPADRAALVALLETYPDCTSPPEARSQLQSLLQRLKLQAGPKPEA